MKSKIKIERAPTGIPGFDELVYGGIPSGSVVCITGPPGSAKTLFSMQFICNGIARNGEHGLYITLEERRDSLVQGMASFGLEIAEYEREGLLTLVDMVEIRKMTSVKERLEKRVMMFGALQALLENMLKTSKAKRLVVDSIVGLALPYPSPEEMREDMFRFATFLQEKGVTSLLITESVNEAGDKTRYGFEQFIGDGFIVLGQERIAGDMKRTISVRKLRFTKHGSGVHPFLITSSGIEVSSEERVG